MILAGSSGGAGLIAATSKVSAGAAVCAGSRLHGRTSITANTNRFTIKSSFRIILLLPLHQRVRVDGQLRERGFLQIPRLDDDRQLPLISVCVAKNERVRSQPVRSISGLAFEAGIARGNVRCGHGDHDTLIDEAPIAGELNEPP